MDTTKFYCKSCKTNKSLDQNAPLKVSSGSKRAGEPSKTCLTCSKRSQTKRKHTEDNEDVSPDDSSTSSTVSSIEELEESLKSIPKINKLVFSTSLYISTSSDDTKSISQQISEACQRSTGYRWTYHGMVQLSQGHQFVYNCSQSDTHNSRAKRPKNDTVKTRTARRMDRFPCNGWLRITFKNQHIAFIVVSHQHPHIAYCDISIPQKWKEFIEEHKKLGPAKIWRQIIEDTKGEQDLKFSSKSVHYYWASLEAQTDDPIDSAIPA